MSNWKSHFGKLILVLLFPLLYSCANDDAIEEMKGQLSIDFSLKPVEKETGRILTSTPQTLVVTIEDDLGNPVFNLVELPLIPFSQNYLSASMSLSPGNYQITEYLILDNVDSTVYASPLEGSSLEYLVSDALPIAFTVASGQVTKVSPEVISLENLIPADFGYLSYQVNIIEVFQMNIEVYRYVLLSGYQPTSANVEISGSGGIIYSGTVAAERTMISLLDGETNYTVKVTRSGSLPYEEAFTNSEMKGFFEVPLEVNLI